MCFKTEVLSDQNTDLSVSSFSSCFSILSILTDRAATASSSLWVVCCFNGATLALAIKDATWTSPSAFNIRRQLTVP